MLINNKFIAKQSLQKQDFNRNSFELLKIKILGLFLGDLKYSQKFQCIQYLNAYKVKKIDPSLQKFIIKSFFDHNIIDLLYGNNSSNELLESTLSFTEFLSLEADFEQLQKLIEYYQKADVAKAQILVKVL